MMPSEPERRPAAVRTAFSDPLSGPRPCPVCHSQPLVGSRTACSAACRRTRSRQRVAARLLEALDQAELHLKRLRQEISEGVR